MDWFEVVVRAVFKACLCWELRNRKKRCRFGEVKLMRDASNVKNLPESSSVSYLKKENILSEVC